MKQFLISFLACLLALLVAFFSILFFATIVGTAFSGSKSPASINDESVLKISSSMSVNPIQTELLSGMLEIDDESSVTLTNMINNVERAKKDNKIKAILLDINTNAIPVAFQNELFEKIKEFKNVGKKVYAYGTTIDQSAYFLGTLADKIFIHPSGMLLLKGYDAEITFYKGLMDKAGVKPQIVYAGNFKSATEPYRLDHMSDANKLQITEMVDTYWDLLLSRISKYRKIERAILESSINDGSAISPTGAIESGLVDEIAYEDQMWNTISKDLKWNKDDNYEEHLVDFEDYATQISKKGSQTVALVHMDGEITGSYNPYAMENISDEEYVPLLRKLEKNEDIKAVVLHVNSPGGDAITSDKIWHAVQNLAKVKPVICYMSNVAASGGYFIASGAQRIWAQPHTVTGSIGVFMMSFDMEELLEDKIGISIDHVQKGDLADYGNMSRPMTEKEKTLTQNMVDKVYTDFKKVVSKGRKMTMDQVEEIAQGRVYMGLKAQELGLVDSIGLLHDAIEDAANTAGISNYGVTEYPQRTISPINAILNQSLIKLNLKSELKYTSMDRWIDEIKMLQFRNNRIMACIPYQAYIH